METVTATRRRAADPLAPAPSASLPATIQKAAKVAGVDLEKLPVEGAAAQLEQVQQPVTSYPPHMVRAMLNVQAGVGAIAKAGWNDFQKYNYQKWDDILAAVSALLSEQGLLITMSQVSQSMSDKDALIAITYDIELIHLSSNSGMVSVWPKLLRWVGMARLRDGKDVYDDKAANKCHTQAHKNFLIHTFHIATSDTPDNDAGDANGPKARRAANPQRNADAQEAQVIEPNTDLPEKPGEVSRQGFKTAADWAAVFLKAVRTSKTRDQVNAWRFANDENLLMVLKHDAPTHASTIETVREIFATLPAAAEAVQAGEEEATAAAAARAAAKVPSPETDPRHFLIWLDGALDKCDVETLADALNDTLFPYIERLPQEHQDVAMGMVRHRERALEGAPGAAKAEPIAAEPKPDPEAELKAEIESYKNAIQLIRFSVSAGYRAKASNLPDDDARGRVVLHLNQRLTHLKKGVNS